MAAEPHLTVLAKYASTVGAAEAVPQPVGGLSGARLWRLRTPAGEYGLRRWPEGQLDGGRLTFLHFLLRHAAKHGAPPVPVPVRTVDGGTFVTFDGTYWQLEPWLPGSPDVEGASSLHRLTGAAEALAGFHRAVVDYPAPEERRGPSSAMRQRLQLWTEARDGGIEAIRRGLTGGGVRDDALAVRTAEAAAWYLHDFETRQTRLGPAVAAAAERSLALQPVLRDVTREHVLFVGDEVSGLVDFGSTAVDHPAVDLARWLGSYVGDDEVLRSTALDAYRRVAPTIDDDPEFASLVDLFDRSGIWLAAYRWLRWIYVDGRRFENSELAAARIAVLLRRLRGC